jgi:hypothetical protein
LGGQDNYNSAQSQVPTGVMRFWHLPMALWREFQRLRPVPLQRNAQELSLSYVSIQGLRCEFCSAAALSAATAALSHLSRRSASRLSLLRGMRAGNRQLKLIYTRLPPTAGRLWWPASTHLPLPFRFTHVSVEL